ncbi:peptidase M48 [Sulfuricaulis limicola]|uniref:Peptidase M48 n=1 Tax=Sulfuricaulis limicola TaxID=1620215 RepID=A0A1B4XGS0_9GAMM|nr:M48 family metallopeptidase [Sulfuricaulis limicola]BAV33957.1 peptidase M48 [Sulfuricaulis limicola]
MNTFTVIFIGLLGLSLLVELWLANRHIRHVSTNRDAVPPVFRRRISLEDHRKAAEYTIVHTRFGRLEDIYGTALLLVWTVGGGLEWLDRLVRSLGHGELVTGTVFILAAFIIMGLIELPVSVYQVFVIENRFGFNKTTPGLFIADLVKKTLLLGIIGVPLAMTALWLMQETGALWWVYVWLLWSGFTLFLVWAYPAWIAPLFNKFTPLKDDSVRERIQALLERTGFRSRGIFVMDGSRRSAHGNAYFTGFGKSKRIVFFDTLLEHLGEKEIEAVLAHELGHFKLRHVVKRMLLTFGMSLLGLALLGWLITQPWFYAGLGMTQPSTHAALMLFMLVIPVFTFFLQPLLAWSSRRHEYEADSFAAEQTDAKDLVNALVKLYRENASTLTPDPLHSAFYDSHPPAALRIAHLAGKT